MNVVYFTNHGRILTFFLSKIKVNIKLLCLISKKTIVSIKEYNVKRHYEIEHKLKFDIFNSDLEQIKINIFKSSLSNQQIILKLPHNQNETGVHVTIVVDDNIA